MLAICKKELLRILKNPKTFLSQILFLIIISLAIWIIWPRATAAITLKSQISIRFFQLGSSSLLIMISMLIPVFCATTITTEKEQNCLEILSISPLKPHTIILGKLISSITYITLLLIFSLPIMGLCFLLGGVEVTTIIHIYTIIFLCILSFAQISIFCSCYLSKTYASLTVSYTIITPLSIIISSYFMSTYQPRAFLFACFILPLCFCLFILSVRKLQNYSGETNKEQSGKKIDSILHIDRTSFPGNILAPLAPKEIDDDIDIVFYKEMYYELLGEGTSAVKILILLAVIMSIPMVFLVFIFDEFVYAIFLAVFAMLITPALGGSSFSQELENGTYDLLIISNIKFHKMFWGKVKSITRLSFILISLSAIPFIVGVLWGSVHLLFFFQYMLLIYALVIFLTVSSLLISARSKTTFYSMIKNYIFIFCLFFLPAFFYILMLNIPELSLAIFMKRCSFISIFSPITAILKIRGNILNTSFLYSAWYTILLYLGMSFVILIFVRFFKRS